MGHDLHIICNHNLQTKTSTELGKDINARFNIPIEVYYQHFHDYEDLKNIKYGDNNCTTLLELGINKEIPSNKELYFPFTKCSISDESFQELDALNKYGKALLKTKNGKSIYSTATTDYKDSPCYDVYLDVKNQDEITVCVHHHVATPRFYFYPRWWWFSNMLFRRNCTVSETEQSILENYEYIINYRSRLFEFIKCIGGNEAFYTDDQGDSAYFEDFATHHTWQETKDAIYSRYGTEVFNISKYIKSGEILNNPDFYPPIFYDDFADLQG
jgi:hypothetical protein